MAPLRDSLQKVLNEYIAAQREPFAKHPLLAFISGPFTQTVSQLINDDVRFDVKGSAGAGNWARCPWVVTMDNHITDTPQ